MSSDEGIFTRIGAYIDGELSEEERDQVEALLAENREYRRAAESFRWLDQIAKNARVPAVSSEEWVAVKKAALRRAAAKDDAVRGGGTFAAAGAEIRRLPWPRRLRAIGLVAAMALVAVSLGLIFFAPGPHAPDGAGGRPGGAVGPSQANAAVEHVSGLRPTTIETGEEGSASTILYDDF